MKHFSIVLFISFFMAACAGGSKNSPSAHSASSTSVATSSLSKSSSLSSSSSSISPSSSSTFSSSSSISSSSSSSVSSSAAQSSVVSSIPFAFTSTSFVSGEQIPIKHTCSGTEVSPNLQWDITSPDIKSFVLIMEDYDAIAIVGHPYVHWNVYNIPAETRVLAEGASNHAMPVGSMEGVNHDEVARYSGPCPPEGTGTHHYFFALYALNKESLPVDMTKPMMRVNFESNYSSAIIQKAEISASYIYK